MTERWVESVNEHREALEAIAEADVPLSDDCRQLLEAADGERNG